MHKKVFCQKITDMIVIFLLVITIIVVMIIVINQVYNKAIKSKNFLILFKTKILSF